MKKLFPPIPTPEYMNSVSKEEADKIFDQWEKDCYKVLEDNEVQFKKDLKKIRLCAFLRGLIDPFGVNRANGVIRKHFSWCPYDEWGFTKGEDYIRVSDEESPYVKH